MKFVLISDTHCKMQDITLPNGDILLHAGDLTFQGSIQEISKELFNLKQKSRKFRHIILINGNHDWLGERNPSLMRQLCKDYNIIYLDHESIEIEGIKFFGSAYTPEFRNWAFNVPRGEALRQKWEVIPNDTNILITHGPPYGILDIVEHYNGSTHEGCGELYERIQKLDKLKLHVFGHLHFNGGKSIKIGDVLYCNASVCTEQYKPTNNIQVIEI